MFGYIKPDVPDLKVKEHELYKALYCGLCRAQRKHTGKLSALFLSYDFVFLYLLRAELTGTKTEFKSRRTAFHKNSRNYAVCNDELLYCACASALLAHMKLKDDLRDEGFFVRLRSRFLLPITFFAQRKACKKLSLPKNRLQELLETQNRLEAEEPPVSPDRASEPSGAIFALFASYGIGDDLIAFAAERIGYNVGRWLYLIDAADDCEEDLKKKRFNPFAQDGIRKEELLCALDSLCEQAELTLRRLPAYDAGYRALLMNVLTRAMHDCGERVLSGKDERKRFTQAKKPKENKKSSTPEKERNNG